MEPNKKNQKNVARMKPSKNFEQTRTAQSTVIHIHRLSGGKANDSSECRRQKSNEDQTFQENLRQNEFVEPKQKKIHKPNDTKNFRTIILHE